ncbi:hypothetical protein [Streptomyces sp. NPDC090026]|uniref:hypothetical protein n=1 Tax=Streptomyces sp. NPDC090026 TaxID=3365923 RepID=UPI003807C345
MIREIAEIIREFPSNRSPRCPLLFAETPSPATIIAEPFISAFPVDVAPARLPGEAVPVPALSQGAEAAGRRIAGGGSPQRAMHARPVARDTGAS